MDCKDKNCPKHGTLATRGQVLEGVVVSDKMQATVIVKKDRFIKVKKYNRYRKQISKIAAHNPQCINAKSGDLVRIMECRKLSKTKNFVVVDILNKQQEEEPKEAKPVKKVSKAKKTAKKTKEVDNG
ncbi:MAG: 30S ribosomal protein S17 [Candidatus Altiarchaeota archaeon]|nr:30S ribosomal protein S17 [Candidatus Altiarchaeota archaeon]